MKNFRIYAVFAGAFIVVIGGTIVMAIFSGAI